MCLKVQTSEGINGLPAEHFLRTNLLMQQNERNVYYKYKTYN